MRTIQDAECWTDHRLVRAVLLLHIVPKLCKKPKLIQPSFNIDNLRHIKYHEQFTASLDDKLISHGSLSGETTQKMDQFKVLVRESAEPTLGLKKRVHQDWFNTNDKGIINFIKDKQKAYLSWQNNRSSTSICDHFKHLQNLTQATPHKMQNEWWERKVEEVEHFADTKFQNFFSTKKEPSKQNTTPLLSADGMILLKKKKNINDQWREHYSGLLSRPSTVDPAVLDQIPQKLTMNSIDLPPTIEEVEKAINQSSCNKVPRMDRISVEIYKAEQQGQLL